MRLDEVISFRKDLLFHGAVQLGWFERAKALSDKAASNFIFHGPNYHGVCEDDFIESGLQLVDTASLTKEITDRLIVGNTNEPFTIGIAGYGTGKSHLALTLATLYSKPNSEVTQKILNNLTLADSTIGRYVADSVASLQGQPFLVVALNGMEDFDLSSELSRQLLGVLKANSIDTSVLQNLRPRFKSAANFVRSFHTSLEEDFQKEFGVGYDLADIINGLDTQDEGVFEKVNRIYAQKMGSLIPASGQESLQDFIRVVSQRYCGAGKPFAGLLIVFDEFGRYIEFAVQKPHIAGPAALQQLFEAVQENADNVFLLAFVQTELKAYASRVMPERREEIDRYLTRFDAVRKVRLSTNLETVVANLLEKKNPKMIKEHLSTLKLNQLHSSMLEWFPELKNYALWFNVESFSKVVGEGCWPLHPLSTWMLYKLSTIGKSLQQRSALSLLAEVMDHFADRELVLGKLIRPTDLLTPGLLSELESSERAGLQRAITDSYQVVLEKYQHELSIIEKTLLKAILLQQKITIKVTSKEDYIKALTLFGGIDVKEAKDGLNLLEREYGVLEWNNVLNQYEIIGDSVPRGVFLSYLDAKAKDIDLNRRRDIFSNNCKQWLEMDDFKTDFGEKNEIPTQEWNYSIYLTNIKHLENQIEFALRAWRDAINADTNKGQLIYCYIGPESDVSLLRTKAAGLIESKMQEFNLDLTPGVPLAILFLDDYKGEFGRLLAEYWVLESGFSQEERDKFANFIADRKSGIKQELQHFLSELQKKRDFVFATNATIDQERLRQMLEQLFDVVYQNRIPFPFDGFHTIRGNAAKDCETFTKELLLGNLDREWLQARNQRERNRGYTLLDASWGIFDRDGSVRLLPTNPKVRNLVSILDIGIGEEPNVEGICLGQVLRKWLAPPFGCNLGSAGLLLSMYIGRRRDQFELLYNNKVTKIEQWLGQAMPRNFYDLSVLDNTFVVKLSEDRVSVWEKLLEEWELEPTHLGKIDYFDKAQQLRSNIALPLRLSDRFDLLCFQTKKAVSEQKKLDRVLNEAMEKIENGDKSEDVGVLSWGTAMLAGQLKEMETYRESWTDEQLAEVAEYYSMARIRAKQLFPNWLKNQKVTSLERLSKFVYHMKTNVGGNLREIGLEEELSLLEIHVEEVQKNVRRLAEIKDSTEEANKLLDNSIVSTTSMLTDLKDWREKAEKLKENLLEAREQTFVGRHEIDNLINKLNQFITSCHNQIELHRSEAMKIYNHRPITCQTDLAEWKTEVMRFIRVFDGHERDLQDFRQVVRQLDLHENQYARLDNNDLTDEDLSRVLEECQQALKELFSNDMPPLDDELIYKDIMEHIHCKRKQFASSWVTSVLSKIDGIENLDPVGILSVKGQLEKMPPVLSEEQRQEIKEGIRICDRRLDELKVEGLIAQFEAFSEHNKLAFLNRLKQYLEQHKASSGWAL